MSKYIDAEVFKAKIMNYGIIHEGDSIPIPFYKEHCGKMFTELLRWVCEEVDDAFPADVQEVVRCRECTFWRRDRISCEGYAMCQTGEGGIRFRRENDFCSIARIREDE